MPEEIFLPAVESKEERYRALLPQLESLLESERDVIANLANISAVLKTTFNFFWVGFYRVEGDELVLGPFQGPLACTRIGYGKGVCGSAWRDKRPMIVPDVEQFPGHIACSSLSRSEIVIPLFHGQEVVAVLDVDSEFPDHFDRTDEIYLTKITDLVKFEC